MPRSILIKNFEFLPLELVTSVLDGILEQVKFEK